MTKLTVSGIRQYAYQMLEKGTGPLACRDIIAEIAARFPDTHPTTLQTQVYQLPFTMHGRITRVAPGILKLESVVSRPHLPFTPKANSLEDLLKLGFSFVGEWSLQDGELHCETLYMKKHKQALYSFVIDGEVMYIGKTRNTLGQRIYQYRKYGAGQATNIKNNTKIKEALREGRKVQIFALVNQEPIYYRDIAIDLAAGLEDQLIKRFRPAWNGRQPERSYALL